MSAPTWDAEAIEATLRRAAAEGLRVRITFHPKCDSFDRAPRSWWRACGVPQPLSEASKDRGQPGEWALRGSIAFRIGEPVHARGRIALGIIAAEVVDEPAATRDELGSLPTDDPREPRPPTHVYRKLVVEDPDAGVSLTYVDSEAPCVLVRQAGAVMTVDLELMRTLVAEVDQLERGR